MLLFMTLLTPPSQRGSPALAWVRGQLPEAGGEGTGAHPTVVAVGEFATQSTQMFEQGRDVLFSVYAPAPSRSGSYRAEMQKTRSCSTEDPCRYR